MPDIDDPLKRADGLVGDQDKTVVFLLIFMQKQLLKSMQWDGI